MEMDVDCESVPVPVLSTVDFHSFDGVGPAIMKLELVNATAVNERRKSLRSFDQMEEDDFQGVSKATSKRARATSSGTGLPPEFENMDDNEKTHQLSLKSMMESNASYEIYNNFNLQDDVDDEDDDLRSLDEELSDEETYLPNGDDDEDEDMIMVDPVEVARPERGRPKTRCPHPGPKKGRDRSMRLMKWSGSAEPSGSVPEHRLDVSEMLRDRKSFHDMLGCDVGPKMSTLAIQKVEKLEKIQMDMMVVHANHEMQVQNYEELKSNMYRLARSQVVQSGLTYVNKKMKQQEPEEVNLYTKFLEMYGPSLPPDFQIDEHMRNSVKSIHGASLASGAALIARTTRIFSDTRCAVENLLDLLNAAINAKDKLRDAFEAEYHHLSSLEPSMDEMSIWGLKPLRNALEYPYFKTSDGLITAPIPADGLDRQKNYGELYFRRDKQKWTTKDLKALKQCISEVQASYKLHSTVSRYEQVQIPVKKQMELGMQDGETECIPMKRKRGRPRRVDVEREQSYGRVIGTAATLGYPEYFKPMGYSITRRNLSEWRTAEEKSIKKMSYEQLVKDCGGSDEGIDWISVAAKLVEKTRKHRTEEDCRLAWNHEASPYVNSKRWTAKDTKRLKSIVEEIGYDWDAVAQEFNDQLILENKPVRTSYQCFFRFRNHIELPKKMVWDEAKDNAVRELIVQHAGKWRLIANSIDDESATKRQIIERYKKNINPMLRHGAFTRVEDCLLLLTIEKLKPFLGTEGHFGSLLSYLPWRFETTWRDRANNLFSDWIVPWTLEEDRMLLLMAEEMNRNWQKISEQFSSFKNRKGCLTRFKILDRRLKDGRYKSLEEYHEAYAMTRYNVFQYKHLKEIVVLLKKVYSVNLTTEQREFPGLPRDREPTEAELCWVLLLFDKDIVFQTINSLSKYIVSRDEYWSEWIRDNGKRRRTFDRRTFHGDNPQSVASALHIRGLKLKPKATIQNVTDFESEIYKFYAQFCRTKAIHSGVDRPYIPSAAYLAGWAPASRLIENPPPVDPNASNSVPTFGRRKRQRKTPTCPTPAKKRASGRGRGKGVQSRKRKSTKKVEWESDTSDTETEEEEDIVYDDDEDEEDVDSD